MTTTQLSTRKPALRPPRLLSLLTVQATSGLPAAAGLLSIVVALLTGLLFDSSGLQSGWADPLNLALTAILYLAPVAVGSGAVEASALRRSGLLQLAGTSSVGRRKALLLVYAACVGWQWLAFLALTALSVLRSDTNGAFSGADLLLPASAMAMLAATSALGVVLGSRFTNHLLPPGLAIAVFLGLYAPTFANGRFATLSYFYPSTYYQPFLQPHIRLLSLQIISLLLLVLACVGAMFGKPRGQFVALLAGLAIVPVFLALGSTNPDPVQYRSAPDNPLCKTAEGLHLCVWPDSKESLDPGLAALVDVAAHARPFLEVPIEYQQPGLKLDAATIQLPGNPRSSQELALVAVRAVIPPLACSGPEATDAYFDLSDWLSARLSPGAGYSEHIEEAVRLPASQQKSWVTERVAALHTCR